MSYPQLVEVGAGWCVPGVTSMSGSLLARLRACALSPRLHALFLTWLLRCSKHTLDIVPLRPTPVWEFRIEEGVRLEGAHGEEIVRCVHVDHEVSSTGEE